MAPVLLDQRGLLKAGIAISVVMCVVFCSGYYLGFHKAGTGNSTAFNKTMALALPKPAHAETTEYERYTPAQYLPGANIDVDSPDTTVSNAEASTRPDVQNSGAGGNVESVIKQTTNTIEAAGTSAAAAVHEDHPLQLASLGVASTVPDQADSRSAVADTTQSAVADSEPIPPLTDTAHAGDARYTIQVGVFADAENASRRKSELESQQLNAYINEYRNKRDEPRFNVRFGLFNSKSSAVAALTRFEQDMSGSGYVTRIRRD
jgi:cell division septation protein DedD